MTLAKGAEEVTSHRAKILTGMVVRVKRTHVEYVSPERAPKAGPLPATRRPAKVARMLALAHHIQNAIDRGLVADRAAVARALGVTRARITQLLNLTLLAADIQEMVLSLEASNGVEPVFEGRLRRLVNLTAWEGQRKVWFAEATTNVG
jgi:plasmid maintenance system antidote protein VapI